MRIAYKIGFWMIILFLIWFIYALFTYEEMLILIPLSAGAAVLPVFLWYFLLVFLYKKLPKLRILIFIVFIPLLIYYLYYLGGLVIY
ncbi:hypothetical protein [Aquibacillus albus]|uniref:Uncharacterized protein n=1 Tax=Aquibacillus albus TaxID=1168171 RepID=A0ABS2N2L4_9BACI|nr:hypothetical protein [Aquibacillus albus]MBM7572367.1 hypothetical protein [Aquibacillus albus]